MVTKSIIRTLQDVRLFAPDQKRVLKKNWIGVFACWLACMMISYAKVGNTMEQSIDFYGPPTGRMEGSGKIILIFQSPTEKVTETYNSKGFCTDSIKSLPDRGLTQYSRPIRSAPVTSRKSVTQARRKNARSADARQYQKVVVNQPRPTFTEISIPLVRVERPAKASGKTKKSHSVVKQKKSGVKLWLWIVVCLLVGLIAGLYLIYLRVSAEANDVEQTSSADKIEAMCSFIKKKEKVDASDTHLAQRNPDERFYSDAR